jgi:phosphohistidine phosphatase
MATWLDRQLPDSTRIWVSPARRAEQTALALGRKFKFNPVIAPMATADQLLELVQWPHAKGCVLVVGHQPTLGQTISSLVGFERIRNARSRRERCGGCATASATPPGKPWW